jgi:hypothetical protein
MGKIIGRLLKEIVNAIHGALPFEKMRGVPHLYTESRRKGRHFYPDEAMLQRMGGSAPLIIR